VVTRTESPDGVSPPITCITMMVAVLRLRPWRQIEAHQMCDRGLTLPTACGLHGSLQQMALSDKDVLTCRCLLLRSDLSLQIQQKYPHPLALDVVDSCVVSGWTDCSVQSMAKRELSSPRRSSPIHHCDAECGCLCLMMQHLATAKPTKLVVDCSRI